MKQALPVFAADSKIAGICLLPSRPHILERANDDGGYPAPTDGADEVFRFHAEPQPMSPFVGVVFRV